MLFRSISLSLAALGVAALCAPAAAIDFSNSNPQATPSYAVTSSHDVSYADLDVTREAGARALLTRIKSAAKQVCGSPPTSLLEFSARKAYDTCMNQAISAAVQSANAPLVAELYHSGTSAGVTASTGH